MPYYDIGPHGVMAQFQYEERLYGTVMRPSYLYNEIFFTGNTPESKVHGANMGPTWVLSAPDEPHIGPMNLALRGTASL